MTSENTGVWSPPRHCWKRTHALAGEDNIAQSKVVSHKAKHMDTLAGV